MNTPLSPVKCATSNERLNLSEHMNNNVYHMFWNRTNYNGLYNKAGCSHMAEHAEPSIFSRLISSLTYNFQWRIIHIKGDSRWLTIEISINQYHVAKHVLNIELHFQSEFNKYIRSQRYLIHYFVCQLHIYTFFRKDHQVKIHNMDRDVYGVFKPFIYHILLTITWGYG